MKIAIVKLSALGDIVNSMVVLQFIKKYYPASKIDWIVEKKFEGVLENNPHIDQILTINLKRAKRKKSIIMLFNELSKVKTFGYYDLVIDFQGLLKTAIISKLISSNKIVGFDWSSIRERLASLAYNQKVNIGYNQNSVLRNITLASEALNMQITINDISSKESFLFNKSNFHISESSYVVFVVGSTWDSRNYPKEKYVEVANLLKKDCVVIWGSKEEKKKAEWMRNESSYVKVMPKLTLDDLKFVISNASLLIGNDTGPSHMSWALNIPSIILFGPTPIERMFQTHFNVAIKSSSKINHKKLNKKDFSIREIKVNDIVKMSQVLLNQSS